MLHVLTIYLVYTLYIAGLINFWFTFAIDQLAMMAIRCLAIVFAPIKTKKLEENVPCVLKIVPIGIQTLILQGMFCQCSVVPL